MISRYALLKFCFGVEIGAYLAYKGHYAATQDKNVRRIAREELKHMVMIRHILKCYGHQPNKFVNLAFLLIGHTVRLTCKITPKPMLSLVAGVLEKFNVVTYTKMAELFPLFKPEFIEMQDNEQEHEDYFLRRNYGERNCELPAGDGEVSSRASESA